MTNMKSLAFALALVAGFALASGAQAAESYRYNILRDGSVIGEQVVEVDGDTAVVTQEISVEVLFVTAYERSHRREETWEDGRIAALSARTDDDGDIYEIELTADGDGYRRTVNGNTQTFGPDYGVVPDWNGALVGQPKGLSAQTDTVYEAIETERLGSESVTVPAGTFDSEHVRTSGDYARDLWYDEDGILVRMAFERSGSEIVLERK